MNSQEVFELLKKIDDGYVPTEKEKKALSSVEVVVWPDVEEIPESIYLLSGLKELNLDSDSIYFSPINRIPETIGSLTKLQVLDLSYSRISDIPDLSNLTSLRTLSITETQMTNMPNSIWKLPNIQELAIGGEKFRKIPENIGDLKSLRTLFVSDTIAGIIPDGLWKLKDLKALYLYDEKIKEIPERIGDLTSLQVLHLCGSNISRIPKNVYSLINLQHVNFRGSNISSLEKNIGNLINLQSLDVGTTQISVLPGSIGNLTKLRSLSLDFTPISALPESIGALKSLRMLTLRGSKIKSIPENIGTLNNLHTLDLSESQIEAIPQSIGSLSRVKKLDLEETILYELPENLLSLDLEYKSNSYSYLTDSAGIYISNVKLKRQPISLFSKPRKLNLLSLDPEYKSNTYNYLRDGAGIYISNVKLKRQPISLFSQPRELIIEYYKQPQIAVNETKVIFLGSEGVGKTHTIKRILNDNHKITETLKETPGISITYKDFATENITYRINFWDFGGQEIMHAMHRCFLTNRTGYVIVVSTRYGDVTAQARVWLRNLRSFAEDAPVIVFVNVWNDGTYYGIDESKLRHEFNNIESIIHCSARDSETRAFAAVTEAIQKLAVKNDSIGMHFPKTWENVRQEIIAEGRKHNCIDSEQYKAICNKYNVTDPSIQGWLLDWFNDLGECFTYQSGEEVVSGERYSMILNPEWLTNAVYLIIREMGDAAEKGVVSHKKIKKLLLKSKNGTKPGLTYSEDDCEYILEVMRKHQLSYKVPAKEKEFIPALLKDSSDEITIPKGKDSISYEIQYDYLPKNVLHNLLVEYYVLVDENNCWRNRFAVQVEGMEETEMAAVISADYESNVISIQIEQYAERETWESLQAIRNKIFEINEKLNLTARDFIVVDSKDEDGRAERANLKRLLKLQERGVERYEAYERGFDIYKLLGKAFGEAAVENVKTALRVDKDISIEGLIVKLGKQSARDFLSAKIQELVSIENIYEYIMSACMIIQKRMIFWSKPGHDVSEDARNDELRDLLGSRGLFVRDQTHTGFGATGKNPGEVDLMIIKPQGDMQKEMTLVEAMNLSGATKDVISKHLNKLMVGYNSSGLRDLFLVSYVELEMSKFSAFWQNYKSTVSQLNGKEFIVNNEVEPVINEEEHAWIKSIKVAYDCGGQGIFVYHICARVAE